MTFSLNVWEIKCIVIAWARYDHSCILSCMLRSFEWSSLENEPIAGRNPRCNYFNCTIYTPFHPSNHQAPCLYSALKIQIACRLLVTSRFRAPHKRYVYRAISFSLFHSNLNLTSSFREVRATLAWETEEGYSPSRNAWLEEIIHQRFTLASETNHGPLSRGFDTKRQSSWPDRDSGPFQQTHVVVLWNRADDLLNHSGCLDYGGPHVFS